MAEYDLKIYPEYFEAVIEPDLDKRKTVEIRRNGRYNGYQVGDILQLNEFKLADGEYTDRWALVLVTHCLSGRPYVPEGFIAMSIRLLDHN